MARSVLTSQDIYSYNIERARGHALHNIMTCEMYEKDMDVQQVGIYLNDWHNAMLAEFMVLRDEVDALSRAEHGDEVARQVRFYVDGLARWIRGSDDWHFEGERHFGTAGPEIQKTREVLMLPRVDADEARAGLGDGDMIREMLESTGVASMQINTVKAQHASETSSVEGVSKPEPPMASGGLFSRGRKLFESILQFFRGLAR